MGIAFDKVAALPAVTTVLGFLSSVDTPRTPAHTDQVHSETPEKVTHVPKLASGNAPVFDSSDSDEEQTWPP